MRARGYLLLEAIIGGALLAVSLSVAMTYLGHYRRATTVAVRKAEASSIAVAFTEQVVTSAFKPDAATSGAESDALGHRGFSVTWEVTDATDAREQSEPPVPADGLKLATVVVTYPTMVGTDTLEYTRLIRKPL